MNLISNCCGMKVEHCGKDCNHYTCTRCQLYCETATTTPKVSEAEDERWSVDNPAICKVCGTEFDTQSRLRKHTTDRHSTVEGPKVSGLKDVPFKIDPTEPEDIIYTYKDVQLAEVRARMDEIKKLTGEDYPMHESIEDHLHDRSKEIQAELADLEMETK